MTKRHFEMAIADDIDRAVIAHYRHEVFAKELGQYKVNNQGLIVDEQDDYNYYLVYKRQGVIKGFLSVTPPHQKGYFIDTHLRQAGKHYDFKPNSYEIRLLTVIGSNRGHHVGVLMLLAAYKLIRYLGGEHIIALGRSQLERFYFNMGMTFTGITIESGELDCELMVINCIQWAQMPRTRALFNKYLHRIELDLSTIATKP